VVDPAAGIRQSGDFVPRLRLERASIAAATDWARGARGGMPNRSVASVCILGLLGRRA
jgi:hypothetical protein